ncbi:Gfo/Idh/MocA family oxidoreductase [Dyadobacter sp. 676]|uniref:Gfo/Idh/MocA family oxidoreductase n=1 Tax=Dyadobacter sp. 676 TaxID=3088362 RepID=A0AAU8FV46_9BACT
MAILKAAIIGGGHIADKNHLPALAKLADRVKAVSICSRDIHKAQALAGKYGVPFAYDNPDEMYRSEGKPDIVINCTANNLHYPLTVQALENGCHVLCEKPPGMNASEACEMADLAQKKGLTLAYNFQRRHAPEYTTLKNCHRLGHLGDIYHIKAYYLRRRGIPGWGNFTNKTIQGGGAMIDLGIHMLDLALGLTGYRHPDRVVANIYDFIGRTGGKGLKGEWDPVRFEVEDACFAHLSFPDNVSIMLSTSFALNMEQEETVNLEVFGTKGGAKLFPFSVHTEMAGELADIRFPHLGHVDIQLQNTIAFLDLCEGKPANICDAAQGAVLQSIVEQIYQSADNR